MKKVILAVLGLTALSFTTFSWGMPVYTGNTAADFVTNPGSPSSNTAGYYIWSDASRENWSVRWTGNDYGNTSWYTWFGSVSLTSLVDGSVKAISFETTRPDRVDMMSYDVNFLGSDLDLVLFTGHAGPGYDGFDFTIDTSVTQNVVFELGSDMFNAMVPGNDVQQGMGIYIGQDSVTPLVQVQDSLRGKLQRFETSAAVPEPSTLLLMAGSLFGFGASRIRRRKT